MTDYALTHVFFFALLLARKTEVSSAFPRVAVVSLGRSDLTNHPCVFDIFLRASPASKSWPKRSATTPRELTLGSVVLGTRRLTRGASRLREPSSQKARASRGKTTRQLRAWYRTLVLSLSKNATSISEALTSRRRNVRGKVKRLDFRAPWRRTHTRARRTTPTPHVLHRLR